MKLFSMNVGVREGPGSQEPPRGLRGLPEATAAFIVVSIAAVPGSLHPLPPPLPTPPTPPPPPCLWAMNMHIRSLVSRLPPPPPSEVGQSEAIGVFMSKPSGFSSYTKVVSHTLSVGWHCLLPGGPGVPLPTGSRTLRRATDRDCLLRVLGSG